MLDLVFKLRNLDVQVDYWISHACADGSPLNILPKFHELIVRTLLLLNYVALHVLGLF